MLMSAGLGTRLHPFTEMTSKALLPILGIPSAQYVVENLQFSGVKTIVANVHHKSELTEKGLLALGHSSLEIKVSDESKKLLGSAGGILQASTNFGGEPFFLANADVLCDLDWRQLEACHDQLRGQFGVSLTLAVFPKAPLGGTYREVLFDSQTHLMTGLGELSTEKAFYIGAAILESESLVRVPTHGSSDFVSTILEPAVREKKVGVFLTSGIWCDIGTPSLWLDTHFTLISYLEAGYFPNPRMKNWQRLLEEKNVRLQEGQWVYSQYARKCQNPVWSSPCYWGLDSSQSDDLNESQAIPQFLGPYGVLYGKLTSDQIALGAGKGKGIGYAGYWVSACR